MNPREIRAGDPFYLSDTLGDDGIYLQPGPGRTLAGHFREAPGYQVPVPIFDFPTISLTAPSPAPVLDGITFRFVEGLPEDSIMLVNVRKALEDPTVHNRLAEDLARRFPPPPGFCYPRRIRPEDAS